MWRTWAVELRVKPCKESAYNVRRCGRVAAGLKRVKRQCTVRNCTFSQQNTIETRPNDIRLTRNVQKKLGTVTCVAGSANGSGDEVSEISRLTAAVQRPAPQDVSISAFAQLLQMKMTNGGNKG